MRLIASDIDGTILGHDGKISDRTVEAFAAAAEAGIDIVFVTGRPPRWLDPIRDRLGHTGTVICSNGAVSYDLGTERVTGAHVLDWATVDRVRTIVSELAPNPYFALESLTGFHVEKGFHGTRAAASGEFVPGPLTPDMADGGIVKMLAVLHEGSADDFLDLVSPRLSPLLAVTHSAPDLALLEMGPLGVNKAVTLAEYAAARGIEATDVVAFGDMPNDIEMLGWAGAGYAMASGHPQAIAAAALAAPRFEDDGVARVIESRLAALRLA
ncbi:Cof subfamily protein (haloacid dehalogenase superfamily) [Arthrobacter stackebrandtii]|uniref:Cof subfamily protein (Haloacid dehalogenase superfamily) n=1 Tax=Arthrobacter stackebrandtii TaxID=272161 RepID=A0ABS4YVH9_9MICC|nr:HAD family hydrolase [Arthrobacter stackebrandtii]MBP2412810.1 Cof subfamily protein (haloacid dehalogenase superfamily) [Arthrobacter stackebrandtii]PYG99840.1 haloacid dehalogenase [Arthrobacter stackebrandtii]